jgi:hypothetical protein
VREIAEEARRARVLRGHLGPRAPRRDALVADQPRELLDRARLPAEAE